MSVQAAYALLCLLFFIHNRSAEGAEKFRPMVQTDSLFNAIAHDHTYFKKEVFGIMPSAVHEKQFWGTKPVLSTRDAIERMELELDNMDLLDGGHALV